MMQKLGLLVMIGLGLLQTPAWAGVAGEVAFASGDVRIGKLAGASIKVGSKINEGDALATGANGYLHIRLPDNGVLILRPNTQAVVSDYTRPQGNPSHARMLIVVSNGVVRSVTGKWAKDAPGQFRMNTPVAALGVRGTDFTVFTDQQTTRAVVSQGGIVMTPLGANCSAQSVGPCEGPLSAELFAGNSPLMLQARIGAAKPEIVDARGLEGHPDTISPPTPDEPSPVTLDRALSPLSPLSPLSQTILDTRDTAVQEERIKWGRWESLAAPNSPSDIRAGRTRVAANAKFGLFRDNSPSFVMPLTGTASFLLAGQESFFNDAATGHVTPASINNARLSVDFGERTFATDFTMRAGELNTTIKARGGLFPDGRFVSNTVSSNASVSGALAGDGASQAGLLFHQPISKDVTAYGATFWVK